MAYNIDKKVIFASWVLSFFWGNEIFEEKLDFSCKFYILQSVFTLHNFSYVKYYPY